MPTRFQFQRPMKEEMMQRTNWTYPFEISLSGLDPKGDNLLEITVVNSWYNRVAGDMLDPDNAWGVRTNIRLKEPGKLSPSGLIGPVQVAGM